jgi:DNA-binding NarL/FixJ family response regulator
MVARYQAGASVREISQTEGISISAVRRQLRLHGQTFGVLSRLLRQTGDQSQTVQTMAAQVAERFHSGTCVHRIAADMQISYYAVRRMLDTAGVSHHRLRDSIDDHSATERQRIARMYQAGNTIKQIADQTGIRPGILKRILAGQGVTLRPGGFTKIVLTPQQSTQIIRLYQAGLHMKEVAEKLNLTARAVSKHLTQSGLNSGQSRGPRAQALPAAQQKRILQLHQTGLSIRQIALQSGATEYYVERTIRENPTPPTSPKRKK